MLLFHTSIHPEKSKTCAFCLCNTVFGEWRMQIPAIFTRSGTQDHGHAVVYFLQIHPLHALYWPKHVKTCIMHENTHKYTHNTYCILIQINIYQYFLHCEELNLNELEDLWECLQLETIHDQVDLDTGQLIMLSCGWREL